MIEKEKIEKLKGSKVGIELSNGTYFKGILRNIDDNTLTLEFLNGKELFVSLTEIVFLKVLE